MRSESEIKEAHGFMRAAYDSALRDGEPVEAERFALVCHALIWVLGHGEIFAQVVEVALKTVDDAALGDGFLDENSQ